MSEDRFTIIKTGLTNTGQVPRGKDIFYHCETCGTYVPAQPDDSMCCQCANICIDTDYFRLYVQDFKKFIVVRKVATTRKKSGK